MKVEELAELQYGLVTRAQVAPLVPASTIDRRLRTKRWIRVFPGVYRIAGSPVTGRQRALAVTLWAGDGAVVSHLVAARLLRLDVMPRPQWIDVTIDRWSGLSAPDVAVHRAALPPVDRVVVDGIPCTSATRTLIDCAPLVDEETLETAFDHARRLGLTSIDAITGRLAHGRAGSAAMRALLGAADARPRESRLEVKLARLLRSSSLPRPVAQFPIDAYRADFASPDAALVCECDGFAWHGDRLAWKRDRRRIAAIEKAGWRVVHATWDDVALRPDETLDRLALALHVAA